MDHLPLPSNPSKPALNIPLVSKVNYVLGEGSFQDFPIRHMTALRSNSGSPISTNEAVLSLTQSWLYFGVLSEFFEEPIDIPTYSRTTEDNLVVICTTPLQTLKERWINAQHFRHQENRFYTSRRCVNILVRALYACEQFEKMDQSNEAQDLVLFSVRILLCSLALGIQAIGREAWSLGSLLERLTFKSAAVLRRHTGKFLLMDHMIKQGWW